MRPPSSDVTARPSRVRVDNSQCQRLASEILTLDIPLDEEEKSANLSLEADVLANFYYVVVAICHQTSPRNGPQLRGVINGARYVGWDYLREALAIAVRLNPRLVYPETLTGLQPDDLDAIIRAPDSSAVLVDVVGRCALLHSLGQRMIDLRWTSVNDLYRTSRGFVGTGPDGPGLLDLLSGFTAYRDPVRKKSLYFLALMRNQSLWEYTDAGNLAAPVDYHEVRGHLRYGTVVIEDAPLAAAVRDKRPVDSAADIEIRRAVSLAIDEVSRLTRHTPSQLHYFFWNVFRSCCRGQNTHSYECPSDCTLPPRYRPTQFVDELGRQCVVSRNCRSRDLPLKIEEHHTETDYY